MFEKFWKAIGPTALTAPGTIRGRLTIADTCGYKVKMVVSILDPTFPEPLRLEIKRVISSTQLDVGEINKPLTQRTDMSAYGVSSFILFMETGRNAIPEKEIFRAAYEEEPVVAYRTIGVDCYGDPWSQNNPLPVAFNSFAVRVVYFVASDWLLNTIVVVQTGPPTVPGQIGPHDLPIDRIYDVEIYKYVGPIKTIVVGVNVGQNLLTGDITLIKAALAPAFSGICLIRSYCL